MVAQIVVDTAPGHDYHSAAMVNETDIFRTADALVKRHGEDAPIHAAMRADATHYPSVLRVGPREER